MCLASAPRFHPKHLHPSVLYIRMPCIVSFENFIALKQKSTETCSLPKLPFPFPKVSAGPGNSVSFLNVTGNFLRRVKVPRIIHLIGQKLGDDFSYSNP